MGDAEPEVLATELLDRLPLDRMVASVTSSLTRAMAREQRWRGLDAGGFARAAVQNVIAVLGDPQPPAQEFCEIYFEACKALQEAGVPYAVYPNPVMTLAERIRWLARQRPAHHPDLADLVTQHLATRDQK